LDEHAIARGQIRRATSWSVHPGAERLTRVVAEYGYRDHKALRG